MNNKTLMQKIGLIFVAAIALWGCKEEIDTSARYVFKYDTILSYLEKHEAYSSYVDLMNDVKISKMSESTVAQLMSARGHYTCFAPTNEAIQEYLDTLYKEEPTLLSAPSFDAFYDENKLDSIKRVIVCNSIIDSEMSEAYETANFPELDKAEFPLGNLNDRKLTIHRPQNHPDSLYINDVCAISSTERDIYCLNGVIHQISKVIAPKDISARNYIQEILDKKQEGFLVAFKAIQACGLMDTLSKIRDERYEELYQAGKIEDLNGMTSVGFAEGNTAWAPEHRLYGFTIFAETDDFWRSQGLDPLAPTEELLEDLKQWILDNQQYSESDKFTTDNDYESESNLIYQWITYHILPMKIPVDRLVFHVNEFGYNPNNPYNYTIPVCEYYTTLGKRRLMKLIETKASNGVFINRFPICDTERQGTGMEIACDADKVGARIGIDSEKAIITDIVNAIVYPIDAPISYCDKVRENLGKQRIRFDGMSMFPEAMNNEIRKKKSSLNRYEHVYIPKTSIYNYFENMQINDDCHFVYYNAYNYDWCNLYADEMKAVGRYELTFTLPPVPRKGTYEIRYCVLANGNRGIAQIYFGSDPENLPVAGIPLDITFNAKDANDRRLMGWADDTDDEDYNAEIDKQMRNNGYMKGSKSVTKKGQSNSTERHQANSENVRHIIVRQTLDPDKTYYLKLKSVLDSDKKEFYMDYLEYCPKEVYDNPETPEDIW